MEILKYGNFEIVPDIQMTKDYYSDLTTVQTQAARNFQKSCEAMTEEEKLFFESFGIDVLKVNVSGTYKKKENSFFALAYVPFCGEYLKADFPELITPEQLLENPDVLSDDTGDTSVAIGNFIFNFEREEFSADTEIPEGFLTFSFTVSNIPWLLEEKPEKDIIAYEAPKQWELHKRIWQNVKAKKNSFDQKRESLKFIEETLLENGLEFRKMGKREYERYREEWVKRFTPSFTDAKKAYEHCLSEGCFLWHLFSFDHAHALEGEEASAEFDITKKCKSILLCNCEEKGYVLSHTFKLKAEILAKFTDVTVTSANFAWTYCKTHENYCGPYFYRPKKKQI